MHDASVTLPKRPSADPPEPPRAPPARRASAPELAAALRAARQDTLATFEACFASVPASDAAQRAHFNPPLWELGHVGWFQEFWIARNTQRALGTRADPDAARQPGVRVEGDALYDSSRIAEAARWGLALPDAHATRADLRAQLAATLGLLGEAETDDEALYFFRLALLHEDMHHEAALYTAQSLGLPTKDPRWQARPMSEARSELSFEAGHFEMGQHASGFAFDNEASAHRVELSAALIDSRVLTWADYLPFVEAGGYGQPRWWTEAAARWLAIHAGMSPRYTRREGGVWQRRVGGEWIALDARLPACHLTAHEAQAWCAWAGRRLPTEAEWERAALTRPDAFAWGDVWEWTVSDFLPYPGFVAHPYRDYSAPWFGQRRVLRGASFMTQPRLHDARYRNFFMPHRNDVPAGFRSCRV